MPRKRKSAATETGTAVDAKDAQVKAARELLDPPPKRKRGATFTGDVREMLENALHESGGRDYFVWVARRRPDVFCQLVGKIIPSESRLTVLAGYQAMPVPVEVREPIPGEIVAPGALELVTGDPSADPLPTPAGSDDDWLA